MRRSRKLWQLASTPAAFAYRTIFFWIALTPSCSRPAAARHEHFIQAAYYSYLLDFADAGIT